MQSFAEPLPDDLCTAAEAAALVPGRRPGKRKHVGTIYRWIARGKLRAWKCGPQTLVSAAEVLGLVTPVQTGPGPAQPDRRQTFGQRREWTDRILKEFGLG